MGGYGMFAFGHKVGVVGALRFEARIKELVKNLLNAAPDRTGMRLFFGSFLCRGLSV